MTRPVIRISKPGERSMTSSEAFAAYPELKASVEERLGDQAQEYDIDSLSVHFEDTGHGSVGRIFIPRKIEWA